MTPAMRAKEDSQGYYDLERDVSDRVSRCIGPIFRTDARGLWEAFLYHLPEESQHYNCRCCQGFIEKYGGLVTATDGGIVTPVVWPDCVPAFFQDSVSTIRSILLRSKVTGPFVSSQETLGIAVSKNGWTHLHAPNPQRWQHAVKTDTQREAELQEDFRLMYRTIQEYEIQHCKDAVNILRSEQFPGYEKSVKIAEWFLDLIQTCKGRRILLWAKVVTAPAGFCHLKNEMLGTLLDDLKTGKGFEACRRAWSKKMNPLQYQRPQAPPSEGQIDRAEKLVEQLGIQRSLLRRFAKIEDVQSIFWQAKATEPPAQAGVFAQLRAQTPSRVVELPPQNMTWAKFERDILPNMRQLEVDCPRRGEYTALVTAEDATAPPILQWDTFEHRNPVSHYVYSMPSPAPQWNVDEGWNPVTALCWPPYGKHFAHQHRYVLFILPGCRDIRGSKTGLALFPEILKAELREVRAVIESHSQRGTISGEGDANGLAFNGKTPVRVKVNGSAIYTLDRWE
jgi:hypothetical protein